MTILQFSTVIATPLEECVSARQAGGITDNLSLEFDARPCYRDGSRDVDEWEVGITLHRDMGHNARLSLGYDYERDRWPSSAWEQRWWQQVSVEGNTLYARGFGTLQLEHKRFDHGGYRTRVKLGTGVKGALGMGLTWVLENRLLLGVEPTETATTSEQQEYHASVSLLGALSSQLRMTLKLQHEVRLREELDLDKLELTLSLIWSGAGFQLYRGHR